MDDILKVLQDDLNNREEHALGHLCGPGRLFPVFPELTPAISYSFAPEGKRQLLTLIVWGGNLDLIHARIRTLLTQAQFPHGTVKYVTNGPKGWDPQLSVFTQRATYLVKTAPELS